MFTALIVAGAGCLEMPPPGDCGAAGTDGVTGLAWVVDELPPLARAGAGAESNARDQEWMRVGPLPLDTCAA